MQYSKDVFLSHWLGIGYGTSAVAKTQQILLNGHSLVSTGRMDPRVGSGRVTILPEFGGSGRVSTSYFQVFY